MTPTAFYCSLRPQSITTAELRSPLEVHRSVFPAEQHRKLQNGLDIGCSSSAHNCRLTKGCDIWIWDPFTWRHVELKRQVPALEDSNAPKASQSAQ